MNMYRKAAVFLHGLAASDRAFMLARLDDSQRAALERLLAELRSLGIPQTATVLSDAGRLCFDQYDGPPPGAPTHVAVLATATPQALWSILEDQPDAVVAAVVSGEAWPWREVLLETIPASRREFIERRLAVDDALTPKACDALLRSVARRLAAVDIVVSEREAGARPPQPRRWWGAGRRRLLWQS